MINTKMPFFLFFFSFFFYEFEELQGSKDIWTHFQAKLSADPDFFLFK